MSGTTMRLLPRTDYDYTGLKASGSSTITVARKIDTSQWREAIVLVRLHTASFASNTINVFWTLDGYTDEDPNETWSAATGATTLPVTLLTFVGGTDTPPIVKNATLSAPFGPLIMVQLKFSNVSSTALTASISIDLNLKGQ